MSSSSQPNPSTIFYQHSPEQHQHQHQNQVKYPENGHDTLSDFVTFVCQETDSNNQNAQVRSVVTHVVVVNTRLLYFYIDANEHVKKSEDTILPVDDATAAATTPDGETRGDNPIDGRRYPQRRDQLASGEHNAAL